MTKKEWKRIIFVFGMILFAAVVKDLTVEKLGADGSFYRATAGGEEQELDVIAQIEGIHESYSYHLTVEATEVTKEETLQCFARAKQRITDDFKILSKKLPIEDYYASDLVEAEWSFSPAGYVKSDGEILFQNIPKEGDVIQATVLLTCGPYEEIYTFPIWVDMTLISQEEKLRIELEKEMEELLENKEITELKLPSYIEGKEVKWAEKKEYLCLKILFLELMAVVLLWVMTKQTEKKEAEKRREEIEFSYADVVNQLVILLRAGMTTRQAWNYIADQQNEKKQTESLVISEAIYHLNRRMKEGEKERIAYELFAKEVNVTCYRRLMRVLIANLEKGSSDIGRYLEEESQNAYEERILLAKKKGEEASTKMLIPLMIMMILVMAIVLIPAIISFSM